jgi:hypothetical protein
MCFRFKYRIHLYLDILHFIKKGKNYNTLMYMPLIKTDNLRRYPISVPMMRTVIAV